MANRLRGRYGYPKDNPFRVTFHPERLEEPLQWKKPSRIFVVSMGDLFHEDAELYWHVKIMQIIRKCPHHTFFFLTKRPERMKDVLFHWFAPNIANLYLGVSVENQKTADERIPILLQIPAAKRFVSVEPMLQNILIKWWLEGNHESRNRIDWVICGGLSLPGGKIQPPQKEWIDSLIEQCDGAGVPIFIKPNAGYPIERREFPK
jgi:protein gp37